MKKIVSIAECLKELNDVDLKNIREEYKKGIDLTKIIASYNIEKSKAITKVFDLIKFEFDEQERFSKEEYTMSEAEIFFFELDQEKYGRILNATLKGIREGVQSYLEKSGKWLLYLTKLSDFCYDKTLVNTITSTLNGLELNLTRRDIPAYSEDVRGMYAGFVFNDSRRRFAEVFGDKNSSK